MQNLLWSKNQISFNTADDDAYLQLLFGYKCSSDSKASKIEISVKYIVHTPMDACKWFTKLNTVPIQEWIAATASVKERNTMLRKNIIAATVPGTSFWYKH